MARPLEAAPISATQARFTVGDPLRALAALGVFTLHMAGLAVSESGYGARVATNEHFASLYGFPGYMLDGLDASVAVFFVLSGYLLTRPFLRAYVGDEPLPSIPRYLRNRALRVLPAFWVVLALALVFYGTRGDSFWESAGLAGFLSSFKATGLRIVLGQAWSLAVEVRFYLLLPLVALVLVALKRALGRRLPRPARIVLLLGLIVVVFQVSANFAEHDEPYHDSFLTHVGSFAPGMLLALLEHVLPQPVRAHRGVRWAAPVVFVAGVALALTWPYLALNVVTTPAQQPYALPLASGMIVAGPLLWQWAGSSAWRVLDNGALRWIGARSYSLFLVHGLILVAIAPHLVVGGYKLTLVWLGSVGLACTLAASALLYRYVELPALRRKARTSPPGVHPDLDGEVKAPSRHESSGDRSPCSAVGSRDVAARLRGSAGPEVR